MSIILGHPPAGAGTPGWLPVLVPVLAAVGYLAAANRARHTPPGWRTARTVSFGIGAVLLAVALSPLVAARAHHDPRFHMLQHLLVGMYAPLAFVLAAPVTLALRTLPARARRGAALAYRSPLPHLLGHPATALVLNVGGLYLLYLTPLYAAAQDDPVLHVVVHVHLFAAGYLLAWSLAGPDPAPRRPGPGVRVAVLVLAAAAHSILAKLLYAGAPRWPSGAGFEPDALRDAARLMYYGGDLAEVLLAVVLFAGWYRRRARRAAPAPGEPCAPAAASAP
ncbi:cytochrome c oxidase assembly protein [Plantactinospora sp. CA-290183]|uniref:cytochrome c oxidase assembly protein n=1 Tax=Plantactinospora sp. CA-290183 TaxID=3240006 RepID=UPI003D91874D